MEKYQPANDNREDESTKIEFTSVYFDGKGTYAMYENSRWEVLVDANGDPTTRKSPRVGLNKTPLIQIKRGKEKRWIHWRNSSTAVLRVSR